LFNTTKGKGLQQAEEDQVKNTLANLMQQLGNNFKTRRKFTSKYQDVLA
jgi:deoxyxylulose-5-phosphate synthase